MASTYLTRTESSGNRKTGTLSFWVKRSGLADVYSNQYVYSNWNTSVGGYESGLVQFSSADRFEFANYQQQSGGTHTNLVTNRLFRDTSAWYHIVVNWDTTQATSSDRYKMYINGVQETSFQSANYPSLNEDLYFNIGGASNPVVIGSSYGSGNYFNGSMSHYHWIDGTAYDASAFGEFDANGVWKIKTSPSVTYGTNGFFILKDGNSVTDQSGNSNNFTVGGGTLTNTEDNPSNVFATANALDNGIQGSTFSNGNTTITTGTSQVSYNTTTFGVSSGKWYWEYKIGTGSAQFMSGITSVFATANTDPAGALGYATAENYAINSSGSGIYSNNTTTAYGTGNLTTGDIISVALDLDNNNLYFAKNGQWGSGSAWDQTFSTALAHSITDPANTTTGFYFPAFGDWGTTSNISYDTNFGNGYFGTTAVASAGTNASGNGIFEYDVPTGYTALCTKGLNGE